MGSDCREDEDYNTHCPACDGTEFSWIEYDPDVKEGRKNREKYMTNQSADYLQEAADAINLVFKDELDALTEADIPRITGQTDQELAHLEKQFDEIIAKKKSNSWPF
jgi:hypothetical protein